MDKKIIGLTGPICSGKNEVLKILEAKGFRGYKFSDAINREIQKRGQNVTRRLQQDVGNELRQSQGPDYWAKKLLELAKEEGSDLIAVDGIRNPREAEYLKSQGALVIAVDADYEVRKKRFLDRLKPSDPKTEKEFNQIEQRDRGVNEADFGQQTEVAMNLADVKIKNNWNTLEPLQKETESFIKDF